MGISVPQSATADLKLLTAEAARSVAHENYQEIVLHSLGIGEREKAVNKLSRTIMIIETLAARVGHTKLESEMRDLTKVMSQIESDTNFLKSQFEGILDIVRIPFLRC